MERIKKAACPDLSIGKQNREETMFKLKLNDSTINLHRNKIKDLAVSALNQLGSVGHHSEEDLVELNVVVNQLTLCTAGGCFAIEENISTPNKSIS